MILGKWWAFQVSILTVYGNQPLIRVYKAQPHPCANAHFRQMIKIHCSVKMVCAAGFDPATSRFRTEGSTMLSYAQMYMATRGDAASPSPVRQTGRLTGCVTGHEDGVDGET